MASGSRKHRKGIQHPNTTIELLESRTLLSGYTLARLAAFTDGGDPVGSLVADSAGDLFGVTRAGGTNHGGSVFELVAGASKITTLASFGATSAGGGSVYPNPVVLDSNGDLFGTTDVAGDAGNDTGGVFEVVKGSGKVTYLASFDAGNGDNATGEYPEGNTYIDANGDLFGTATEGGQITFGVGGGTYWELPKGSSTITPLDTFPILNNTDNAGFFYQANPNFTATDSAGDVFGISEGDAKQGYYGYVWEIPAGTSTINTLATFAGTDGSEPYGPITIDSSGDVFGTTLYGGTGQVANSASGDGVVWEVKANSGAITDLASFSTATGYNPAGVSMDTAGDLFGTAFSGGTGTPAEGTAWELPAGSSTITPLAAFGPTVGGKTPNGALLIGSGGNLFGTTTSGGDAKNLDNGTIFELVAPGNGLPTGTAALSPVVSKTTLPRAIVAGSSAHGSATVNVTNIGSAIETGSITVAVYASADGVVDGASTLLGTVTKKVNIKAGATAPVAVTIKSVPASLSGTYTLLAQTTDVLGSTVSSTTGPGVTIAAPFISYQVGFVKTTLPLVAVSGQKSTASEQLKITNNGNILSSGTTTIAIYASTDGTVANGTLIVSDPTSVALKPGASKIVTVPFKALPAVQDGNYFLVAQVTDPKGNATTASTGSTYDLAAPFVSLIPVFDTITLPQSIASGTTSKGVITLTVTNDGNVPVTGQSLMSVSASTDGTIADGNRLTTTSIPVGLKPGKSTKIKVTITNFSLLTPGTYFIVVQITNALGNGPVVVSPATYMVT